MKSIIKCQFILIAAISFAFTSCNQEAKQKEKEAAAAAKEMPAAPKTEPMPKSMYNAALDAAKMDPLHYKVIHDSLGIRILEVTYKPGESSMMHAHPDLVVYAVEGGTVEMTAKDGTKQINEMKKGMTLLNAGTEHTPRNVGKTTMKLILFEVNRPRLEAGKAPAFNAVMDAVKIDPAHYKVLKDSLGIRVLEINYKAGETSVMHAHPDNALYVIQGSTVQMTTKDGSKQVTDFKNGVSKVGGSDEHMPKNVGKTALKAILVEVQRPRN